MNEARYRANLNAIDTPPLGEGRDLLAEIETLEATLTKINVLAKEIREEV